MIYQQLTLTIKFKPCTVHIAWNPSIYLGYMYSLKSFHNKSRKWPHWLADEEKLKGELYISSILSSIVRGGEVTGQSNKMHTDTAHTTLCTFSHLVWYIKGCNRRRWRRRRQAVWLVAKHDTYNKTDHTDNHYNNS